MLNGYNPLDWYWLSQTGRVYGSARQTVVDKNDPAFKDWSATTPPTPWPRDTDGKESDAELAAVLAPYRLSLPGTVVVPASVSRAQAKIALFRASLLDQVKVLVEEAGGEVELWFNEATSWERQNPNVKALGSELKLSDKQIDDLFVTASQIAA